MSKILGPVISLVPDPIKHYGIKYYLTYTAMAVVCAVGMYVYWDPLLLLGTYFMILV